MSMSARAGYDLIVWRWVIRSVGWVGVGRGGGAGKLVG